MNQDLDFLNETELIRNCSYFSPFLSLLFRFSLSHSFFRLFRSSPLHASVLWSSAFYTFQLFQTVMNWEGRGRNVANLNGHSVELTEFVSKTQLHPSALPFSLFFSDRLLKPDSQSGVSVDGLHIAHFFDVGSIFGYGQYRILITSYRQQYVLSLLLNRLLCGFRTEATFPSRVTQFLAEKKILKQAFFKKAIFGAMRNVWPHSTNGPFWGRGT